MFDMEDNYSRENLLKLFNKAKSNLLLTNSHITCQCKITKEQHEHHGDRANEFINWDLSKELAKEILKHNSPEVENDDLYKTFKLETFVFSVKDFKSILEGIISQLTDEQIKTIRERYV